MGKTESKPQTLFPIQAGANMLFVYQPNSGFDVDLVGTGFPLTPPFCEAEVKTGS